MIDLTVDCTAPIVHKSRRHGKQPPLHSAWVSRNGKNVYPKQALQQEAFGASRTIERPQSVTSQSPDKPKADRSRLHTRAKNAVVDYSDQASRNRKKRKRQHIEFSFKNLFCN